MKKKLVSSIMLISIITGSMMSCNSPSENVKDAQEDVADANEELEKAKEAYLADIEQYRKDNLERIEANNKLAQDYAIKMEKEKKEVRAEYKEKMKELEQKNNDMKMKMNDYKAEGKEKWEVFKAEYNHDMDELGKSFKDLTTDNVK